MRLAKYSSPALSELGSAIELHRLLGPVAVDFGVLTARYSERARRDDVRVQVVTIRHVAGRDYDVTVAPAITAGKGTAPWSSGATQKVGQDRMVVRVTAPQLAKWPGESEDRFRSRRTARAAE